MKGSIRIEQGSALDKTYLITFMYKLKNIEK